MVGDKQYRGSSLLWEQTLTEEAVISGDGEKAIQRSGIGNIHRCHHFYVFPLSLLPLPSVPPSHGNWYQLGFLNIGFIKHI